MKFLLVFLFLLSSVVQANAPEWVLDYAKIFPSCEREWLCAVGEGENLADALTEARSEIAKFFSSKIKSSTKMSNSSEQKGSNANNGTFDEWTNKTITVETNELISGLEIRKQEQVGKHVYVLMTLSRDKTAELLKEKILELDNENVQLLESDSRFTYPKILKNLFLSDNYRERYNLLAQTPIQLKVKKEMIQEKISKLPVWKIAFVTKGKQLPAKLTHTIMDLLAPLKIVIVAKTGPLSYLLQGEMLIEEQYLKVEGFKKINVVYKITLFNSKNEVLGKMSALSEQVARTSEQAIENAMPDIKEALEDNLNQLSSK